MQRQHKKIINKSIQPSQISKIEQQEETFRKISRALTANTLRPSEHHRIILTIKDQIQAEASPRMIQDYRNLMDLADYNKRLTQNRQRSMRSYNKIKTLKTLNDHQSNRKCYEPLLKQIQNTEGNLQKRKYKKYNLQKFKSYLIKKQAKQQQKQQFVQNTLIKGIKDIKNYIPSQAKLHKKLCIFGQLIKQQKDKHIQQIKNMIIKQKSKTPKMSKSYQIYLINHYLVQKLMVKIYQNSSAIQNKNRNSQTYKQIKNQMVSEIIKEKGFAQALKMMEEHCQNQQQQRRTNSRIKNYAIGQVQNKKKINRKNIYRFGSQNQVYSTSKKGSFFNKSKQNQMAIQFFRLYEHAQNKIEDAKLQLNFVNTRKNNYM